MGTLIGVALFDLVVLWIVVDRVRKKTQTLNKGADQVFKDLARTRSPEEPAVVTVWSAHPLSDHMIKELVGAKGYKYVGERTTYNGTRGLQFKPPKPRKLSLDV